MPVILQIVTQADDDFANAVLDEEQKQPGAVVRRFDLTTSEADYDRLLEEIFKADAIHVW